MQLKVASLVFIVALIRESYSQCVNLQLLPNSAGLAVTQRVNTPLSSIKCSNATGSDVLAETYYCGISQIRCDNGNVLGSNGALFVVVRDANTLLVNTVGDWMVIYNAASLFNLQAAVGTSCRVTVGCTNSTDGFTTPILRDLLVYLTPNLSPTIFEAPGVDRTFDAKATPMNTLVYKLTVQDPENDFLTYSLATEPAVDYFNLDPNNGEIRTTVDLRVATEPVIYIRVNVSDGYSTVGPFTVTARLENLNTRPDITNLPTTVHLREDAVGGFIVSTLTINDPDIFNSQDSLTPICTVTPQADQNKFVQMGNVIKLTGFNPEQTIFDFETTRFYNISCTVTDGFLTSQNENILVNISDVNEPPVFNENIYYCQLKEASAGGSLCDLSVTIRDPENNAYSLDFLPGNNSNRFGLLNTDRMRLTFNIDYDVDDAQLPSNAILTLAAVDSIGATGTAKVAINIADENDNAPIFSEVLQAITVDYNTKLGIVGSVKATDKDKGSNGQIDYKMMGINPPNYLTYTFALGNGEIQYARNYDDRIAGTSAFMTILATDRGSPRRSSTGTVVVSFLATTTTQPPTTTTRSTTPTPTTTTTKPTTTTEYNFFAHSENVALFTAFVVAILLAAIIGMFLCARLSTLGYCCFPNSAGNPDPSDDYEYDSREGSPYYDDYRGKPGEYLYICFYVDQGDQGGQGDQGDQLVALALLTHRKRLHQNCQYM
ncbi:hypothetical protein LOTGIDRAFT_167888 [Lottia gigantea]|uniref:Cadherin domain-containing protein n=1 Tax=Lottia gigantea TaxID=225164 RepID=V3ZWH4_LOTGI|nr:hypothetical protein LOTGIDRAFT_167888 [Lottia gigantea]ESO85311.1 hypothetical protein LOTGIDRAFT_167888 [Lottia gigantea]